MMQKIKKQLNSAFSSYMSDRMRKYALRSESPFLEKTMRSFLRNPGKQLRSLLFILSYLGYSHKRVRGLFRCAAAFELLHECMLIHDDIIDNSDIRRDACSLHKELELKTPFLSSYHHDFNNGKKLALLVGDMLYALAIDAFLSIDAEQECKERALKEFIHHAFYAGIGEFEEVLYAGKKITKMKKSQIYRIYDFKTARYSFCSPLVIGALLAGKTTREIDTLYRFGICIGRAFQIKDDCTDFMDGTKNSTVLNDVQERKRTILLWYAYSNASCSDKVFLESMLNKKNISNRELARIQSRIYSQGTLECAQKEITRLLRSALKLHSSLAMKPHYKALLADYCSELVLK
jgi:geranylgeranyl diphosphate synthase, type I